MMRFGQWLEAFNIVGLMDTPDKAWRYVMSVGGRVPELEPVILRDLWVTYKYARNVIRGRWPEAEEVIATDPHHAYLYARNVIGGRWPEVEAVIATDPRAASWYADKVLRPWLEENPGGEIPKGFEKWL